MKCGEVATHGDFIGRMRVNDDSLGVLADVV